jgi:hypothetical protein
MSDGGKTDPRRVEAIVAKIKPLLAGEPPEIQGGVIVDLLATFIAGHHPELREDVLATPSNRRG